MTTCRIALANLQFPATPDASVRMAEDAVAQAGRERADVICFPECFVPGYRAPGRAVPPPDQAFLDRAWLTVAAAAAKADVAVVLGTERVVEGRPMITALVINRDGDDGRLSGQSADRSVRGAHLCCRRRAACFHGRSADLRRRHLSRGVAVSGDRAVGRATRSPRRLPSAIPRGRAGQLSAIVGTPSLGTRFTRKPCSAARRKTPATSRP